MTDVGVILPDSLALEQIKPVSRNVYKKSFDSLREFIGRDFEDSGPSESELLSFIKDLREVKKAASSTLWTTYSMINSVCKAKYNLDLKKFTKYSFHSYRRSSATAAADAGATSDQMVDFFGWSNHKMTSEYISTSKQAVAKMAERLGNTEKNEENETSRYFTAEKTVKMLSYDSKTNGDDVFQNAEKVFVFPNFSGEFKF